MLVEVFAGLLDFCVPDKRSNYGLFYSFSPVLFEHLGREACENHGRRDYRMPIAKDQRVDSIFFQTEPYRVRIVSVVR